MFLRDFQITMRKHDFDLYRRARDVWQPIELRIRKRIPKRFLFGDVGKVVIQVGPEPAGKPWQVLLGVGVFHYPDFDMPDFLQSTREKQMSTVVRFVRESFSALSQQLATPIPWVFDELNLIERGA